VEKELIIRKVRTASGAIAVQLIRYEHSKRIVVRHIGSSHTDEELSALYQNAEIMREQLSKQLSLFPVVAEKVSLCLQIACS